MNNSRKKLFCINEQLQLSEAITVPDEFRTGIARCRVIYGPSIVSVEFSSYNRAQVYTLKLVVADDLEYDHKYLDRTCLTSLIEKEHADDVLIVKNGFITDTSYSNIAFTDGRNWFTPDTPLLKGTMREMLLRKGILKTERINTDKLMRYTQFRLINSMLEFDSPLLPVNNIF
jgi:4-amino-4-deoxychorismate lyase